MAEIWEYTDAQWGEAQADRYVADLSNTLERLTKGIAVSRRADQFAPDLRRIDVGRHAVFFQETDAAITVIRVLHQRMMRDGWCELTTLIT